ALLAGCSSPSGPDPGTLTSVKIVTKTSGSNLDADGYRLLTALNTPRHIGINDSTVYDTLQFGDHQFTLDSVATNCVVDSGGAVQNWYLPVSNANRFTYYVTCT
ncbi:MAG: hypothetical protein ACREL4_06700, partial [Gemmatimonadales bacterium]